LSPIRTGEWQRNVVCGHQQGHGARIADNRQDDQLHVLQCESSISVIWFFEKRCPKYKKKFSSAISFKISKFSLFFKNKYFFKFLIFNFKYKFRLIFFFFEFFFLNFGHFLKKNHILVSVQTTPVNFWYQLGCLKHREFSENDLNFDLADI
jgi:hypothetical protein